MVTPRLIWAIRIAFSMIRALDTWDLGRASVGCLLSLSHAPSLARLHSRSLSFTLVCSRVRARLGALPRIGIETKWKSIEASSLSVHYAIYPTCKRHETQFFSLVRFVPFKALVFVISVSSWLRWRNISFIMSLHVIIVRDHRSAMMKLVHWSR